MFLVDTNVWLERLLDQDRSEEVGRFLERCPTEKLAITDFAFHSIAVIMKRLKKQQALLAFVQDVFVGGGVELVRLVTDDTAEVVRVIDEFGLDFDDAYQYVAARKNGLAIVSFDADFDRTKLGRMPPVSALKNPANQE